MVDHSAATVWREASDLEDAGMIHEAIEKYKAAICKGSVDAMINLGNIYDDKINPPDAQAAVALYEMAVEHGSATAAWNLAKHYQSSGNDEAAGRWMKTAAELGDEDAQAQINKGRQSRAGPNF